jgi:hypothetical protein
MGVVFLALIIACAIGATTYLLLVWLVYEPYTTKNGIGIPEHRLLPGVFAAALAPCGLFIFAWTARQDVNWAVPTIGIMIFSSCVFVVSVGFSLSHLITKWKLKSRLTSLGSSTVGKCHLYLPAYKLSAPCGESLRRQQ